MVNVNVNLSDDLQEFVVAQVSSGQFKGPSEESLETLLIEGLESGEPIALDDVEWRRIREDFSRRVGQLVARVGGQNCDHVHATTSWT